MELRAAVGMIPNDQAQLADIEVQEELTKHVIAYEIAAYAADLAKARKARTRAGSESIPSEPPESFVPEQPNELHLSK